MTDSIQQFKWSTGEKYEQSIKTDREKYIIDESKEYNNMKKLLFEDGTESCMRISNKREDANTKLNERCMIESISQNPFLPRNNYINDLQVQDEFLKPRNSNFNIET
uniref:Uncharacterized protein n=1 Tax=viral metagenome TaxID=1070528 RepID=A0A6C0II39_9ZZZZ